MARSQKTDSSIQNYLKKIKNEMSSVRSDYADHQHQSEKLKKELEIKQLDQKKNNSQYEKKRQTVYLNDREIFAKPFVLHEGWFLEKHIKKWFPKFDITKMIVILNQGNLFFINFRM